MISRWCKRQATGRLHQRTDKPAPEAAVSLHAPHIQPSAAAPMPESRAPPYLRRLPGGVAVHSSTDGGEGYGAQPVLQRQLQ